jgi:Na+/proline symporter
MAAILFFTVTIVWFIPPMAAAILFPDISTINELKPLGKKATAGIYLAMGIKLFPTGMIGVMICTIFSATISTLDHTLNRNAGIFVKNFYNPILRKKASDKELMVISYISTIILGGLTIFSALFFSKQEGLNLFDLNMKLGVMMSLPFLIPLTLGVVYKKTPAWAGWSTMVIGMIASWLIQNYLSAQWVATHLLHISRDISARELIDIDFFMGVFIIILLCTAWFFTTGLFFKNAPKAYKDTVEQFFQKINTPVDYQKEHGSAGNDREQFKILGGLCLAYATFFMLLMFIPNTFLGKSCFGFIGLINIIVGFLFLYNWKKGEKHIHEN